MENALIDITRPISNGSSYSAEKPSRETYAETPAYFESALQDAERLLKYASEVGTEVDSSVRDHVLHARAISHGEWDEETAANLLSALAKLAAQLKPVTAESLKTYSDETTKATIRNYWIVAICLAGITVPFSAASFVASALATTIKSDIVVANDLAVKLRTKLGPPLKTPQNPADSDGAILTQLQQFAATIRSIDERARQLNVLMAYGETDPYRDYRHQNDKLHEIFQLPKGLDDWAGAANDKITVYQDVRYFAQSLVDDMSVIYGAITVCILPVLYALLGTCAYLLRNFEQQMSTRTFILSRANSARFLIAVIGGAVVGLFDNFTIGQGASIPPLAIAFLVGYAVEVFFTFLDSMLQPFAKGRANSVPTVSA